MYVHFNAHYNSIFSHMKTSGGIKFKILATLSAARLDVHVVSLS